MRRFSRAFLFLTFIAACGDSSRSGPGPDMDGPPGGSDGPVSDAPAGCPRALAAADRKRYIVVSRATDNNGRSTFEVLAMAQDGTISPTGHTFDLPDTQSQQIQFTPDGEIGLVVENNAGAIG